MTWNRADDGLKICDFGLAQLSLDESASAILWTVSILGN